MFLSESDVDELIRAFRVNALIAAEHVGHDCPVGDYSAALTDAYGSVLAWLGVPEHDVCGAVGGADIAHVVLPPSLIVPLPTDAVTAAEVDAADVDTLIADLLTGDPWGTGEDGLSARHGGDLA